MTAPDLRRLTDERLRQITDDVLGQQIVSDDGPYVTGAELALALLEEREKLRQDRNVSAMQDDVLELLRALGISDHARPYSCHRVVQDEILPKVRALLAEREEMLRCLSRLDQCIGELGDCYPDTEGLPEGDSVKCWRLLEAQWRKAKEILSKHAAHPEARP